MGTNEVVISPERGVEMRLGERVRTTWALVAAWTHRDLRSRYRQSLLRSAWSFIQPLTILVTYGVVFTAVLDVSSGDVPYLTFAWSGLVAFTFFSHSLGQGVGSIHQAGPVISRLAFPRDVIPLSVVAAAAVDLGIMVVTLVALSWVQVGPPGVHLLGLVPVAAVLVLWTTAATLVVAAVNVYRRDLTFAVPLALLVAFMVTPVMYPASLVDDIAGWINLVNPLAVVIEGIRGAVYGATWPDAAVLAGQLAAGALATVGAFVVFRRLEPRMSDYV